jgi:hypothetical protein
LDLLIGLVSGGIGAVIAAAAAYWFQVHESRRLAKGAVVAVYIELVGNMTAARAAASDDTVGLLGPLGRVGRGVFLSETARLAVYLSPEEMLAVAWAYQLLPEAEEALSSMRRDTRQANVVERALLLEVGEAIAKATRLLNRRVWSEAEKATMNRMMHEAAGDPGAK